MAKPSITITITSQGEFVDEVTFDRPIINIGKLSTSTLQIDDLNVSRKHAVIQRRADGSWRVTDLGSTNGTIVDGKPISQVTLKQGDQITLGSTILTVSFKAEDAAKVAAAEAEAGEEAEGAAAPAAAKGAQAAKKSEIRGLGKDSFYQRQGGSDAKKWVLDVSLLWGETVIASRSYDPSEHVDLSSEPDAVFAIPASLLGSPTYRLVEGTGKGFRLNITNPMLKGDVLVEKTQSSIEALALETRSIPLKKGMRARLQLGEFTLLLSHSPDLMIAAAGTKRDHTPLLFLLLSAIVQISLLTLAWQSTSDPLFLTRDPRAARAKLVKAIKIRPPEEQIEPEKVEIDEDEIERDPNLIADDDLQVDPNQIARPEMPVQDKPADPLANRMARPRNDAAQPNTLNSAQSQAMARDAAQQSAVARSLRSNESLIEQLRTNPDLDSKVSAHKGLGGVGADGVADFGGDGSVNPFGNYNPGAGSFVPVGEGGGAGGGGPVIGSLGSPIGGRDLGNRQFRTGAPEPKLISQPSRIRGELDAQTVQRIIRRGLPGIKWCYQERVQANRDLQGKVTLSFVIMPNGTVNNAAVTNSTMNDAALNRCIVDKMSRWRFPQPKDGGMVDVAYPLILKTQ